MYHHHSRLINLYSQLNKKYFDNAFDKCELFGINFPKSKYDIKGNYKKDINNFYNVYKAIDGKNKQFISIEVSEHRKYVIRR